MPQYSIELEGQQDFYNTYLPLINHDLTMESIQNNNNDGQIGDTLIEFKLSINDLNKVLFQSIKYLSALRIKGIPVPSQILLISLNSEVAYLFNAEDYRTAIEQPYTGGASINNTGFIAGNPLHLWHYNQPADEASMLTTLKEAHKRFINNQSTWFKINIDVNDIVSWASMYYKEFKGTKASFLGDKGIIGEIRQPNHLAPFILPYNGPDNDAFAYIMDKLNDDFKKKDLGAFYTPVAYAEKSNELVYDAIRRFQKTKNTDYIILDRCAGTGNLEQSLNDNVPADIIDKDVLSHVIVNTYEFYEYQVLKAKIGDKVRYLIPPKAQFTDGTVKGSNALSQEFLDNDVIKSYIDDDQVTMIIYENPPFAETTSIDHQKKKNGKTSSSWKQDAGVIAAKQELKGAQSNDMSNVFIWTAFHYYLRQNTDSAIIFSPVKYWKSASNWMDRQFDKGFAFNRRWFHTTSDTVVSCILWKNQKSDDESFDLDIFDLSDKSDQAQIVDIGKTVTVKRTHQLFSQAYYEETTEPDDIIKKNTNDTQNNAIWSEFSGKEAINKNVRVKAKYNSDIICYIVANTQTFELAAQITRTLRNTAYNGNGFHLRSDNYLTKLPIFAAGWWSTYNPKEKWYLNGIIYRSGDGKDQYEKDVKSGKLSHWLDQVLFYTCLEYYNKIRSLHGSDNRWYFNELCLHNNKGKVDDPADKSDPNTLTFNQLNKDFFNHMDQDEAILFNLWNRILEEAKLTKNYDPNYNYGIFQITQELNTKHKETTTNGRQINVFDYPELNGDLKTLRSLIKDYYHTHIQDNLFKYEFLK